MAIATKSTTADLNDAVKQVNQLNERLQEAGKRAGNVYLDSYEKAVAAAISTQRKLAEQSQVDVVRALVDAQAKLTTQLTNACTATAREVLA